MAVADMVEQKERPAHVRFETRTIEDKRETLKQGRYVGKDVDYALVTPPYSKDCVEFTVEKWLEQNETYVRQQRLPKEWHDQWKQAYLAWKQGKEIPLNGTSVKNWSALSPTQVKTLLSVGIHTIEDLAGCNDEGLRRIGMGGVKLKNLALAWTKDHEDHGAMVMESANLKQENERLKAQVEELSEKFNQANQQLMAFQNNAPTGAIVQREQITAEDLMDFDQPKADYKSMDRAELERIHKERFGRKPNSNSVDSTIIAKLEQS